MKPRPLPKEMLYGKWQDSVTANRRASSKFCNHPSNITSSLNAARCCNVFKRLIWFIKEIKKRMFTYNVLNILYGLIDIWFRVSAKTYKKCNTIDLSGVYRHTWEYFTRMYVTFTVKDCKFWHMLGTHGHWALSTGHPYIMVISDFYYLGLSQLGFEQPTLLSLYKSSLFIKK